MRERPFKMRLIRCEKCGKLYDINDSDSVRMYGGFGEMFEGMLGGLADKVFSVCPACGDENYAGTEDMIFGEGQGPSQSMN